MKKVLLVLSLVLVSVLLTGCGKTNKEDALKFKKDYESLNGKVAFESTMNREIEIDEDNPFIYADLKDINEMIDNKETFMVYFGFSGCPWCRSVIPTFIEVAKEKKIDEVYYVNVRPDNDKEKEIRDFYDLDKKGKVYVSHEGTKEYHEFLKKLDSLLPDYSHGTVSSLKDTEFAGTKRVGAPNFFIIKEGTGVDRITGISKKQTDGFEELTDQMNRDMKSNFEKFFEKYKKALK